MTLAPKTISADLILASNSPRRRELLQLIAPEFTIAVSKSGDETFPESLLSTPHLVPEYLAIKKAEPYIKELTPDEILITADTVVISDGRILGKPHSEIEAAEMLNQLSASNHTVVTGVALTSTVKQTSFITTTEVVFDKISDADIQVYINQFRPFDKAGAYGIQEWIGCIGIERINGDFYNVMGLPLHDLYKHLINF